MRTDCAQSENRSGLCQVVFTRERVFGDTQTTTELAELYQLVYQPVDMATWAYVWWRIQRYRRSWKGVSSPGV